MRISIARKLYLNLIISLFVLWLAVIASIAWVVKHETDEIFDSSLQEVSQRLLSLAALDLRSKNPNTYLDVSEPLEHDEYLTYQVFNSLGNMVIRSHDAPITKFPTPLKVGYYNINDQHFYVEANSDRSLYIAVAEKSGHRISTFKTLLEYLLWPLMALLPLSAIAVYLSVKVARRSILSIDQEISKRGEKDLEPINTTTLPLELLNLGESVNALMQRLKLAIEAERNFSTNSAHELRTPIATALAQLDVLKLELADQAATKRISEARAYLEKLQAIVVKLLQVARADSGLLQKSEKIDLKSLLQMLIRDMSYVSSRPIQSELPDSPIFILGDIDALGIVIQNTLENADRHAEPNSPIQIVLYESGELVISNDCVPIPSQALAGLTQRFARLNQERAGSGIGLSLVDTLLKQARVNYSFKSPCYINNRGFAIHIFFIAEK